MAGIVKNNRGRVQALDNEMQPLDFKICVIALFPGDEGYDKMMEKLIMNTVCEVHYRGIVKID